MTDLSIKFPEEWSKFLTNKEVEWQELYGLTFHPHIPCLYDAAFLQHLQTLKPWEDYSHTVREVFETWAKLKLDLHEMFSLRQTATALAPMKMGVGLFLEMLYWTNSSPMLWKIKVVTIENKPVNWEERLEYILAHPNKYHSYIQLTELFSEMEKIFAKQQILIK